MYLFSPYGVNEICFSQVLKYNQSLLVTQGIICYVLVILTTDFSLKNESKGNLYQNQTSTGHITHICVFQVTCF